MTLLLAQAGHFSEASTFSWGVVVFLLGLAVAYGEVRMRVHRLERDMDKASGRQDDAERRLQATETQTAVMASTLGRIEKGQEALHEMLRDALGRRDSR
jgi:hypothetical protein